MDAMILDHQDRSYRSAALPFDALRAGTLGRICWSERKPEGVNPQPSHLTQLPAI